MAMLGDARTALERGVERLCREDKLPAASPARAMIINLGGKLHEQICQDLGIPYAAGGILSRKLSGDIILSATADKLLADFTAALATEKTTTPEPTTRTPDS